MRIVKTTMTATEPMVIAHLTTAMICDRSNVSVVVGVVLVVVVVVVVVGVVVVVVGVDCVVVVVVVVGSVMDL